MHQFIFGAMFPFAVGAVVYACRGFRGSLRFFVILPTLMFGCGLWAVVPDVPRLLGAQSMYERLAGMKWTDVFFLHHTIDRIEVDSPWYSVVFVVLCLSMLFSLWREVRIRERG